MSTEVTHAMTHSIDPVAAMREAAYARMPSYGKIPWSELIAAVGAAIGCDWKRNHPDGFIGHEMVGAFNMNSLNRVVTYFCERDAIPIPAAQPDPRRSAAEIRAEIARLTGLIDEPRRKTHFLLLARREAMQWVLNEQET